MELLLQFYSDSFETLRGCLGHGLKMCILFGHFPQIIFCRLVHKVNFVYFWGKINRY